MSIDWMGYHRAILVSVIGGLFAKKAVYSSRPGYLKITFHGERYLDELSANTSETRSKEEGT